MSDDLQKRFDEAVAKSQSLPAQGNDTLLLLYGLFKQAKVGDVSGKKPGRLDIKGRAKYEAWESHRGMPQEEAMTKYIDLVTKLGS